MALRLRDATILWLITWLFLMPLAVFGGGTVGAGRTLHVGDSDVLNFDGMTTAVTGDPSVADIVPLSSHRLLVNAKGVGQTIIIVFDKAGRHQVRVTVPATDDGLPALAAQIQSDIGLPSVTARAIRDVVFLEGTVPTQEAAQRAEAVATVYTSKVKNLLQIAPDKPLTSLAETYAALINETWGGQGIAARVMDPQTVALTGIYNPPVQAADAPATADGLTGTEDPTTRHSSRRTTSDAPTPLEKMLSTLPAALNVVNLVQTGNRPAQQILVRAKVIDIQRNAVEELGIRWGTLALDTSKSGNAYVVQGQPILFGQSPGDIYHDPFSGGGPLKQIAPFAASLSALITENKARVLSEPSLLVRDGAEGSMLVGGEIPIPVAQTNNGSAGATISVVYKPYGVRLHVQPTVVEAGTIELTTTPEVSELDYGDGVSFNGLNIPALTVRRATSTLQMRDGETLVIGGLYNNSIQRQVERIPLLSQIPILGEFFKYTNSRKNEDELLILLSVEIVPPNVPIAPSHLLDKNFPNPDGGGKAKP